MAVYQIGDGQYELPDNITDEQLQSVVAQMGGSSAPQKNIDVAGDAAKSLDAGINSVVYSTLARPTQMVGSALHRLFPNNFDAPDIAGQEQAMRAAQARDRVAVNSVGDINSPAAAASYAANTLAGAAPSFVAGPVGAIGTQGAQGADQTYRETGDPLAAATSGALNAGVAAARVPFLQGGGGVAKSALRGAAGNVALSPLQAAAGTIPQAIASGNPADAVPSGEQFANAAASSAIVGAAAGAALHGGAQEAPKAPDVDPQAGARQRLSQRISDQEASLPGADIGKVTYGSKNGAENVLENVHNDLAEEIRGLVAVLKPQIDPRAAANLEELIDRTKVAASIRDARNKVKSTVSEDDFARMSRYVGQYAEGSQLIDAMRQSNELTGLFREGMKGGVSQYTDYANPIGRGGSEAAGLSRFTDSPAVHLAATVGLGHVNPLIPLAQGAVFGAGRAIDAVTGRRSRVAKFVNDNINNNVAPVRTDGLPSILHQQAMDRATSADEIARGQQMRAERRAADDPGLQGFDASIWQQTGLRPYEVNRGLLQLFKDGRITGPEFNDAINNPESLMRGNRGNGMMDMLNDLARKGQVARDPEWSPQQAQASASADASARPDPTQSAYFAQAQGNQARATEAQTRISQHPTLDPKSKQLINTAIARIAKTNNRIEARGVLNDLLNVLPDDSSRAIASQEVHPLITQIRHATREQAEKAQPLTTEAVSRDSRGRPTQRVPLNLDTDKLTDAFTAAVPRGDVPDGANAVSRLRAQLYKKSAGINKPAYEGSAEPNTDYLKRVADFHDKAVHDPADPKVKASYSALARETVAQFKSLGNLKVETWRGQGEPYHNSKEMMQDVAQNGHLWFLPTDAAFGSGDSVAHPMLADTGLKTVDGHPLLVNDVFRIVHDFFGHTQGGFSFGPKGEYNAFKEHAQMYTDAALPALAAETLAQNAWVNFGPHMRRADGSIPQKGEPDYVPPPQRKFSDQKAYAVPQELLNEERSIPQGLDLSSNKLSDRIAGFKGIAQHLTPEELEKVTARTAQTITDIFNSLPDAPEMASVAYSGRAKRGWYENSAKAIVNIFGAEDAPRFTALLAALSPQTSVQSNLTNTLNVWRGWISADRPTDKASIMRILGEEVEGENGPGSVLDAWINNTVRALSAADGEPIKLSGPKVSSFAKNLQDNVDEVTNDTWMANYAAVPKETFRGLDKPTDDGIGKTFKTKGSGYLAMNALTRKAASILTKRTGQEWTPREVQETVWSWAKALYEKSTSSRSAEDIVRQGDLSGNDINSVPDFEKLFVHNAYKSILDEAGYGDFVDALQSDLQSRAQHAEGDGNGSDPFSAEEAGIGQDAFRKHLTQAARRLDSVRTNAGSADRADVGSGVVSRPGKIPDAPLPALMSGFDPEGRELSAHFIPGISEGMSPPEIKTAAKQFARVIMDAGPRDVGGDNGRYNHGNNAIFISHGLGGEEKGRVLAHETGHAIEHLADVAKTLGTTKEADPKFAQKLIDEMSKVSSIERPHLWDEDQIAEKFDYPISQIEAYRTRLPELLADNIAHYMRDPASMKKTAPNAAKFIRDLVNPSKIGKVIAFASMAGLALPALSGAFNQQDEY